jgi:site-specific recombinase XerD
VRVKDKWNFHVPDKFWGMVVPVPLRSSVVCLACFDGLAKERGVAYATHLRNLHFAVEALRDHLARQMQEIGEGYEDNGLAFASQTGNTMSASNLVNRHFRPLLKRAKLARIRLHDLRHTCATLLLIKGVHPKYVQDLLGHANISITLDTYSHVIPGMGNQTVSAMEEVFG